MTRQRPTLAPGSLALRTRLGAFSTADSIQTPSLSVRGGVWFQKPLTSISPNALASAFGEIEVNGFWNHTPPRTDKDGVWIESAVEKAPNLVRRAKEPGANVGRCRVIELQPNDYTNTLYNLHQDDNNRLNPDGTGWIVRGFFNLS